MKKIGTKVFLVIFTCSLFSVVILGGISIKESSQNLKEEAETSLLWMARDYAGRLSSEFSLIEDQQSELGVFLKNSLDYNALQNDRNYLSSYEPSLSAYLKLFSEQRMKGKSAWVYFSPTWSDSPHDVYYADEDKDGIVERQPNIPLSYFNNAPYARDDKQWWYGPIESGSTFWTNPYQRILSNKQSLMVISCAHPLYLNRKLICVYGANLPFDEIYQKIANTKVYQSGYVTLFNEKLDVIVHPHLYSGTRFTSDNLLTIDGGKYRKLATNMLENENGICPYTENSEDMIMSYAKLSNGWVLGITLPESELYSNASALFYKLLFAIIGCALLSLLAAYSMGRYLSKPILKLTNAAKQIGTGDFSVRTYINSKNELQLLADSMNHMTEDIASLQMKLIQQAHFDELTGAKNFVKFKIDASELLLKHPEQPYALSKFDIDKFKVINELHGFQTGDRILCQIADALNATIDPVLDTYARITADEFVLLFSYHLPEDLNVKRRRFLRAFWDHITTTVDFGVLFKEGVYHLEPNETDISLLFEKVNLAHRIVKQRAGSTICVYGDSIKQISIEEKAIENSMQKALDAGEFQLYLQPKYRLSDERIVGAEALVRWQSEFAGFMTPNRFIPLFERNGFIKKLDFYMLEQACIALRSWLDQGLSPITISVNFSRIHLYNPSFLKKVCDLIDHYEVPRHCIEIELTESVLIYNSDMLINFSNNLRKTGLKLSMDDFGSGYSSLGLLKSISVDAIKLDRSFFVDAQDENRTFAVLSAIIIMAKNLKIAVVAEGVEEGKHILLLKHLGCDMVQGFYYAKPMPLADFTKLFTSNQ